MLNNIKNGCERILTTNTLGGQFKSLTGHLKTKIQVSRLTGLDLCITLMARAYKRLTPSRLKRLARGVALALVGSLCLATPTSQAQQSYELTPERYSVLLIGELQTSCLFKIAVRESNIRYDAINKTSGASGAWQFMNPKVRSLTPLEQVEWAIRYAEARYNTPCEAWDYWQRNYWW